MRGKSPAAAAQPQEAVGQDAALQESIELVLDELQQVGPGGSFDLGEEGRGVLLHQAGLLGAVTLVVDWGTIRHPVGLPTDGLHAMLMSRLWYFTVSNRAARRHCPLGRLLSGAHLKVSTMAWVVCGGDET